MAITFEESPELKDLAQRLKDRYYMHIGHSDLDAIYFTEKDGEPPQKHNTAEIQGITSPPIRKMLEMLGGTYFYCIHIWKNDWENIHPNTREWLMFEMLYSVDPNNNGKVRQKDIVEFGPIAEFFANDEIGLRWRNKDGELPELLGRQVLPIPLPPNEEEDESAGSTL